MGTQAFGNQTSSRFGNVLRRREKKTLPFGFGTGGLAGGGFGQGFNVINTNGGGGGGFIPPPPGGGGGSGGINTPGGGGGIIHVNPTERRPGNTVPESPFGTAPTFPKQIGLGASNASASKSVLGKTPAQRAKKGKGGRATTLK